MATVSEKVAAESPYQRAAAIWIARKTGKDADRVYGVNWFRIDGETSDAGTYFEGEWGLEYRYGGSECHYDWTYNSPTPGQFLEECVAILNEGGSQ